MHGKCNVLARKLTLVENKFLDKSRLSSSFARAKKRWVDCSQRRFCIERETVYEAANRQEHKEKRISKASHCDLIPLLLASFPELHRHCCILCSPENITKSNNWWKWIFCTSKLTEAKASEAPGYSIAQQQGAPFTLCSMGWEAFIGTQWAQCSLMRGPQSFPCRLFSPSII